MTTHGFYKYENEVLQYADTSILSCEYCLIPEDHLTYTYPIDGWYWFDNEEEAKKFFGIVDNS